MESTKFGLGAIWLFKEFFATDFLLQSVNERTFTWNDYKLSLLGLRLFPFPLHLTSSFEIRVFNRFR